MSTITRKQVVHVAKLANIPVTRDEAEAFAGAFAETLAVIEDLKKVDTSLIEPTNQVTGLENVLREDVVDEAHVFTQAQALANAPLSYEGLVVVPRIIDQD